MTLLDMLMYPIVKISVGIKLKLISKGPILDVFELDCLYEFHYRL